MKKIFCLLSAALLATAAFSQERNSNTVYNSDNGVFTVDMLSHGGWGYSFVTTDDFKPKGSGEVFANVLKLKVYPVESFGIELGGDLSWRYFGSKENAFDQRDHIIHAVSPSSLFNSDKSRSSFSFFSVNTPLLLKIKAGGFCIGAGAEAQFNISGQTGYYYRDQDKHVEATTYKAKVNTFTYGFVGTVGFNGFSVFAKFYPKGVRFLPEGGLNFSFWTLGISAGL